MKLVKCKIVFYHVSFIKKEKLFCYNMYLFMYFLSFLTLRCNLIYFLCFILFPASFDRERILLLNEIVLQKLICMSK